MPLPSPPRIAALAFSLAFLVTGCVVTPARVAVVAPAAPPPPRIEVVPAPPPGRAELVYWVPGRWHWDGREWVWIPGHYQERPYRQAVWVPGHWAPRPGGWVWVEGHWR